MRKIIMLCVLTLSIALTACSGEKNNSSDNNSQAESTQQESNGPVYGGSVVVGVQQDVDSLDPHLATAAGTREILFNVFEGLVKADENGNLVAAVASDYEVSEDGKTYTFTLRDGIMFHNGNLVTVEDIKYSLERCAGLLDGTPLVSALKRVESVEIVDDSTVAVHLKEADSEILCYLTCAIIPADSAEGDGTPVGTGPFKFVSYTPQQSIVLAKNENYWQPGVPYLDEVTFKIVANTDSAMLELKAGSIDIFPYLTDDQANELSSTFNISSNASDVIQALFINNAVEPFDDVRVRQALVYAVSSGDINDMVSGGRGYEIATSMLPGLSQYYVDLNEEYAYNVEKAKELLADAGYADGFDMTITVPANYQVHMDTAQIIVEQLKLVGINATIDAVDWGVWLQDVYTDRKYQTTVCGITGQLAPSYVLSRYVSDSSKNFVNFADSEFDEVFAEASNTMDMTVKTEGYHRLQEILAEQAASVYIQVPPTLIAINPELAGYKSYPIYVQDMASVYFTK